MPEHVDVHHQQAGLAISRWDTAASAVTTTWNTGKQTIRAHTGRSPWGNDAAGQAFKTAYLGNGGGPEKMIRDGDQIIEGVTVLGEKVRTAVTRTKETDQAQAAVARSI